MAHAKLYDRKNARVAADVLNDHVLPFYVALVSLHPNPPFLPLLWALILAAGVLTLAAL